VTSMPQAVATNQSDTCAEEVVLGVDTHKDTHVAAVVTVLGGVIECKAFPTTAAGYRSLLGWARGLGLVRRAGVECTGSYGAGLTRYLLTEGVEVMEVNQPDKSLPRHRPAAGQDRHHRRAGRRAGSDLRPRHRDRENL
jgi:transposase